MASRSRNTQEEFNSPDPVQHADEPETHHPSEEKLRRLLEEWKAPIEEGRREDIRNLIGELAKEPGRADPQAVFQFTHGEQAVAHDRNDNLETVTAYLSREGKLDSHEVQDLVRHMNDQVAVAGRAIADLYSKHPELDLPQTEALNNQNAYAAVLEAITEKSRFMPVREFHLDDPHMDAAWNTTWNRIIDRATQTPYGLEDLEKLLSQREEEAASCRDRGETPQWLDPRWFAPERTEVTPENEALGHNPVHNRPIDLLEDPRYIQEYLRGQMDAHLLHHQRQNGGHTPAQFAKKLIDPYLDQDLAADFPRFDLPDHHYIDDGPINFQERVHPLVQDPTDPGDHLRTTYARSVRDSLMLRGLAGDADVDSDQLLSLSLPRNALALDRLAQFCNLALEHHSDDHPERQDQPWRIQAVHWTNSPRENLENVRALSGNFTDPAALLQAIDQADRAITREYSSRDLVNPDAASENYPFLPRAEAGNTDVDHPERVVLRELLHDLDQARELAEQFDFQEQSQRFKLAFLEGRLPEMREHLDQEGRSWPFIEQLEQTLQQDPEYQRETLRLQGASEAMIESILRARAGQEELRERLEPRHRTTPEEYARMAVDHLAHVDFLVQTLHQTGTLSRDRVADAR